MSLSTQKFNLINIKEDEFYQEAFARNIGIFSKEDQEKIGNTKVAIAGMGGVGGHYLLNLARMGVKNFSIADCDFFEISNINRQAGAAVNTINREKVEIMEELVKSINPFISINLFPRGINADNVNDFLNGASVVLDGLDFFNIKDRLLLFRKARENGVCAITSAPIGFGASLLIFSPGGMSFEEYFDIRKDMEKEEMLLMFALGLSPSLVHKKYFQPSQISFNNKKAPSVVAGTLTCAAMVISEVFKIIKGQKINPAPFSVQFDPYVQKYKKVFLRKGNRNIKQRIKKWYYAKIF